MSGNNNEWSALLKDILRTREFKRAPLRTQLLSYLFERIHKPQGISRRVLAEEVFKSARYDEGAVGERCLDLRNALKDYGESGTGQVQKWRCELPAAVPSEGYRLRFINQVAAPGATGAFWQAHLSPARNILIIHNEPLFYRDASVETITRYIDINLDHAQMTREIALEALRSRRPAEYREELYPSYLYLLSGEVAARDYIAEWFEAVAGVKTQSRIARRLSSPEIAQSSPVLLGNLRTNSFIRSFLESSHCQHLDYVLAPQKQFGVIEIRNVNAQEEQLIGGQNLRSSRSNHGNSLLLKSSFEANEDVYGIVTRIPNPYDEEGAVTIISSDSTRAVEQIAHTLTSEHRLSAVSIQTGWHNEGPKPTCFQCIFAVRLGPVNMDTEGRPAVFLAMRTYDS